jgi:hypothetical protein
VAFVLNDRVKETTTTTGTGTVNLDGAATGFETFVAGVGNSNSTYYCIAGQTTAEFEVGIGTVTDASPDTLSRTTILSSSNSDSAVDFSAGTKDVFCTLPAAKTIREFDTAVNIPTGTTAQRSSSAAAGDFRYNTSTGRFEGYSSAWNALGGSNTFSTDIFAGDGSDTTFTLSQSIENENDLFVFIDGVFQAHNSYSVSGTTLTFSTAPANSRVITAYSVKSAVSGNNVTISTMDGDGSDTTLTLAADPVNENNVQVYIDGVYQNKDTFAVSGTTLTFSAAPPNGTKVEAITLTQTNINTATQLADADGDTKVQVEESSDEDKIRFDTAGSERVIIDNAGKVGIGESTPLGNLHVKSGESSGSADANADELVIEGAGNHGIQFLGPNNSFMQFLFGDNDDSDVGYLAYDHTNNALSLGVNAAERFRIDSSGQIGVGTTSPQRQFHIAGGSNTGLKISGNNTGSASGDGFDIFVRDDNSGVELVQRENTFMTFHTNNTERMRIDASGNLGIGTTPASASSTTRMHIHNGTSTAILQLTGAGVGTTDSDGTELAADDNGDFRIRNFESGSMQFFNNGSERMRIDSGGNLLVGQTTLNYNAAGASMGSGGLFRACVEGGMVAALNRRASDGVILNFYKDGSTVGSISTNANSLPSDRNFKRDISDLDLGLNLVTKLKPSQFRYKIS